MKRLRLHGSMSDCLDNDRHTEFIAVNSIAYHYLSFLSPATLLPSSPEIDDSRGVINEKCSASLRPNAEPCVSVMTDMFHLVGGGAVINMQRKCSRREKLGLISCFLSPQVALNLVLVQFSSLSCRISAILIFLNSRSERLTDADDNTSPRNVFV